MSTPTFYNNNFKDKTFFVTGVSNKKSIAYSVARNLLSSGARVILSVQNEGIKDKVEELFCDENPLILINDLGKEEHLNQLSKYFELNQIKIDGLVHSVAYANYSNLKSFLETSEKDFLEATNISCFSFISLTNALKHYFNDQSSIVTLSISDTKATAYGMLGPIKAALNSTVPFLAQGLTSQINSTLRVNAVAAGPLKTSASAGIPNYVPNYLYAEKLTLRNRALQTDEVANAVVFLLSNLSSGINGTVLTVDAGMSCNFFNPEIVAKTIG